MLVEDPGQASPHGTPHGQADHANQEQWRDRGSARTWLAMSLAFGSTTTFQLTFAALPMGVSLDRVVLMAPASLTHHSDMAARYHSLPVVNRTSTTVTFTGPDLSTPPFGPEIRGAPRGVYMLFLVTNTGAVSDATWVFLP